MVGHELGLSRARGPRVLLRREPRSRGAPMRVSRLALVAGLLLAQACAAVDASRPAELPSLPEPLFEVHADLELVAERYPGDLLADMALVLVDQAGGLLWTDADGDPSAPRMVWGLERLERRDNYVWPVLSVLTLGVANLLGAPVASHEASFRISLELHDADGTSLARWNPSGSATGYWALWWGQDDDDAPRQARLDALHAVLADARRLLADPEGGLAAVLDEARAGEVAGP